MKYLAFLACVLAVIGCNTSPDTAVSKPAAPKTVVIATLMTHPALDEVRKGLVEEMTALGYVEGKTIQYQDKNANGQVQLAATIAKQVAGDKPDAMVAITTPMAQAAVSAGVRPTVFAAVTDPVGAKLVQSLTKGADGVTGTSDAWPYEEQLRLIREILPKARTLGVLFNPGEAASQYGMANIRRLAPQLGFTLVEGPVSNTGEVYQTAASIVDKCDALFLSSDNTVIGGSAGAIKVATQHHKALFAGDSGTVEKGALASVSVGYLNLGRETAKLLDKVLKGNKNLPTVVCAGNEIYVNLQAAKTMGVPIPESVRTKAKKVY